MILYQRVSTIYGNGTIVKRCQGTLKGWFEIILDNPELITNQFHKRMNEIYGMLAFKAEDLHPEKLEVL
jgi:hypothetical protein